MDELFSPMEEIDRALVLRLVVGIPARIRSRSRGGSITIRLGVPNAW